LNFLKFFRNGKESKFLKYFFHDFLIASIVCPESIGLFVVEDIDISQRKICANVMLTFF
jgi:hypothetical protein